MILAREMRACGAFSDARIAGDYTACADSYCAVMV
jgi:hypothetical protein